MKPTEQEILERLANARNAYLDRDYNRALIDYLWVAEQIKDDPDNLPIVQIEIGWSYYYSRKYEKAITYLEKALASGKLDAQQRFDALRLIGFAYEGLGKVPQALDYLKRALQESVNEHAKKYVYFELGKILFQQNRIGEAEQYLKQIIGLFREEEIEYRLAIAYYLGFAAFLRRDLDSARQYFYQIIHQAPTDKEKATGYFGLAHIFFEEKDAPVLFDTCEKILTLNPEFEDKETLAFFTAFAFMYMKMWPELEQTYRRLQQNYPDGRYRNYYPVFEEALSRHQIPDVEPRVNLQKED